MAATTGRPRRQPWRSIGLVVYVFLVTMLGTTLPTPLYPDYQHRFGFGQVAATRVPRGRRSRPATPPGIPAGFVLAAAAARARCSAGPGRARQPEQWTIAPAQSPLS